MKRSSLETDDEAIESGKANEAYKASPGGTTGPQRAVTSPDGRAIEATTSGLAQGHAKPVSNVKISLCVWRSAETPIRQNPLNPASRTASHVRLGLRKSGLGVSTSRTQPVLDDVLLLGSRRDRGPELELQETNMPLCLEPRRLWGNLGAGWRLPSTDRPDKWPVRL